LGHLLFFERLLEPSEFLTQHICTLQPIEVYKLEAITGTDERILEFIWIRQEIIQEETTNTDLRADHFSPTTLAKQLPALVKRGLIQMKAKKTRGAWRQCCSLTEAGRQWMEEPVSIYAKLYGAIIEAFGHLLSLQDKIEPQLYGIDLIRGETRPKSVRFTAELTANDEERWVTEATWRFDEKGRAKLEQWTFPNMKTHEPAEMTETTAARQQPDPFYHNPIEMERLKRIPVSKYPMSKLRRRASARNLRQVRSVRRPASLTFRNQKR
jgi:DNA-binding PadR family transcriptional regulator